MRTLIYNSPESHVALVTHGGFLHYLTEDWSGYVKANGTGLADHQQGVSLANFDLQELAIGTASTGDSNLVKTLIVESHTFENTAAWRRGSSDPPISTLTCFTRWKR
jgi:hypothetical protein